MRSAQVFVVGSLHFDVVVRAPRLPRIDETLPGTAADFVCGGKGGNQAVAAARHGARTAMAGQVGHDLFAERLLANLDGAGVECSQVRRASQAVSGMSVAIVDEHGDYGAVIVSGANLDIDPGRIAIPPETAVVLLQNEIPEAVNLTVARAAKAAGAAVVLNAAPARALAEEVLGVVDILVVNRVEAAAILDRDEITAAAASELADGKRTAIVTLGADGVAFCTAQGPAHSQPGHDVSVVSTHGAGDVFVGALAARLAESRSLADGITYAQAAAALHVSSPLADRAAVTQETVQELLTRSGKL